jgi:probable HAF family extracellular repeat protein
MRRKSVALIACLATAAACTPALAAEGTAPGGTVRQYPYTLVDLGTLGGPQSGIGNLAAPTQNGLVVNTADTAQLNPYAPNDNPLFEGDPYVQHAELWRHGTIIDLGTLGPPSAGNSSWAAAANTRGNVAGLSDNGSIDPLTGYAEARAVFWRHGQIADLGTLGGNQSVAFDLNDRNQVVGEAANTVSDPYSMGGWATQTRAVLWQRSGLRELGTLGGPDAGALYINNAGQIVGFSYTGSTPNEATGIPTVHPFLWQSGHMIDLGTLGGVFSIFANLQALNDRGEVAGLSNLAGDQATHPFLWKHGAMTDLGTLGGDNGIAQALNNRGSVSGSADLADASHHAYLWSNGRMRDLRPFGDALCSNGNGINDRDQVVGNATDCQGNSFGAALWDHGIPYDLNTLVAPSPLRLTTAEVINDRGEITGTGVLPDGNQHSFLLIPNRHSPSATLDRMLAATPQRRPAMPLPPRAGLTCAFVPAVAASPQCVSRSPTGERESAPQHIGPTRRTARTEPRRLGG